MSLVCRLISYSIVLTQRAKGRVLLDIKCSVSTQEMENNAMRQRMFENFEIVSTEELYNSVYFQRSDIMQNE